MSASGFIALLVVALFWWLGLGHHPKHPAKACTHGASSAYAWTDAQGKTHVSKPSTSGCIPRR